MAKSTITIQITGPASCGKTGIAVAIMDALRAAGVEVECDWQDVRKIGVALRSRPERLASAASRARVRLAAIETRPEGA